MATQRAVLVNLGNKSVLVGVAYDDVTGLVSTFAVNNPSPDAVTIQCGGLSRTITTTSGWVTRDVSAKGWTLDTMPPFAVKWPG